MKSKVFLIAFLLSFIIFLLPNRARAQIPTPEIPCNDPGRDPEFHELRPYQASATCTSSVSDYASFCGNNLTLTDEIAVDYSAGTNCRQVLGKITCSYNINVNKPITINLSNANLPIMGNTEDELDDAQKTNEYVSWYLNGIKNNVDFAGPINKLLPQDVQFQARIKSIEDAKILRHNQIVVCINRDDEIIDCKDKDQYVGVETLRLDSWDKTSTFSDIYNKFFDLYTDLFPDFIGETINNSLGNVWSSRMPPLMGDPQYLDNPKLYLKHYNEWRGKACIIVPLTNILICVDNPLAEKKWSKLFDNIPMSSTEDIEGNIVVDNVSNATNSSGGLTVTNVSFNNQSPSTLFFSHIEETDQLSSLLQDTYAPSGADKIGAPTEVDSTSCRPLEVRSNKGDDLFASQLTGNLSYSASFNCDFSTTQVSSGTNCFKNCLSEGRLPSECGLRCSGKSSDTTTTTTVVTNPTCTKQIAVNLSTKSNTPKIDDVWSRLVAGPASVFKRIFPKTNTEGSVGQIMDIPGSTNITYTGAQADSGSLNLPHFGGISEYFLKGIQTALRPKGYGESISFSPNSSSSTGVDCNKNAPDVTLPRTIGKDDLADLAVRLTKQEGNHIKECYNDVVGMAIDAGVNPTFALMIWITESNGSNYNLTDMDFGINNSSVRGFDAQITRFLELPTYYKNHVVYGSCFDGTNDLEMFFNVFYMGSCAAGGGTDYMNYIRDGWNWFTSCPVPGYPTDMSCY